MSVTRVSEPTSMEGSAADVLVPRPKPAIGGDEPAARPASPLRGGDLKHLIQAAAGGDDAALRRLIAPFLSPEEKLLYQTLTARMGIIKTYNFAFVTDRKVGDLEITPFTGALNVEIAYLDKIDALVVRQPAFPILMRVGLALNYVVVPALLLMAAFDQGGDDTLTAVALVGSLAWLLLALKVLNPAAKWAFLRLRKSGLICKLTGSAIATFIFADRNKLGVLNELAAQITEARRLLVDR